MAAKGGDAAQSRRLLAIAMVMDGSIIKACVTAWNWLIADPARFRSLGSRDWATDNV